MEEGEGEGLGRRVKGGGGVREVGMRRVGEGEKCRKGWPGGVEEGEMKRWKGWV